jgi:hypothetical protein
MSIICINSFSVCLRDRDGGVTSCILGAQLLAYDALPGTKCLPEDVNCDVLARIGRILLNELMEMTGRAQKVECWGNEVVSRAVFVSVLSNISYRLAVPCRAQRQIPNGQILTCALNVWTRCRSKYRSLVFSQIANFQMRCEPRTITRYGFSKPLLPGFRKSHHPSRNDLTMYPF